MNRLLILFLFTLLTTFCVYAQQADPVVLKINNKPVLRSEVESAYKKANELSEKKESVNDFINSFIDFKMNVEEAKAQHLDTAMSYIRDLSSARVQMSYKYMEDMEYEEEYLRKIYDRTLENVEINHVLLPFNKDIVLPSDTVEVYMEANNLRKKLLQNGFTGEDYKSKDSLSTSMMTNYTQRNGYIGWVAPFMFPAKIEDAIYSLPVNEISKPIRTSFGYHIIQVLGKRPAIGSVELEQVHFMFTHIPPPQHQIDSVGKVAWREYNKIKSGDDFQSLCNEYSRVMQTGDKGCYFGIIDLGSTMPASFINAAFGLENIGDISKPVLTDYGFHILRLKNKIPVPEYAKAKRALRDKIIRSDRALSLSEVKRKKLREGVKLNINKKAYRQLNNIASTVSPQDSLFLEKITNGSEILFSIEKTEYTVQDFADFIRFRQKQINKEDQDVPSMIQHTDAVKYSLTTDQLEDYFEGFVARHLTDYYYSTLEKRFPEFDQQMKEISEGMLLFAVKNKNIWERSKTDENALSEYFNKNKSKYKLEKPRYKGIVVYAKNEKALAEAQKIAEVEKDTKAFIQKVQDTLNKESVTVQMEPGSWVKGNNPFVDNKVYEGKAPNIRRDFPYFFVTGEFIDSPKDYMDVKNAVELDYQEELEKGWNEYLKNKYKVEVDKSVLKTIK